MILRLLVILTVISCTVAAKLDVIYEWKFIDFVWDSEEQKQSAIAKNEYDRTQIFTIDLEKLRDGRVLVTTPRFNTVGVPATLSTVSGQRGPGGPLLSPYPNWSWHTRNNCSGITSVWRTFVDKCNRLWVLDSGKIGENQVCEAQLLVFDSRTDRLQQRITIPNDISHDPRNRTLGLLITPVIETEGFNCERSWAYVSDAEGGGLIIWNGRKLWRLDNHAFEADPAASSFTIAGDSFFLPDGLLGLALSPGRTSDYRRLFFRPLASFKENSVSLNELHRSENANNSLDYTTYKYNLPSQAAGQVFSREGILFFGLATEMAIACWNMHTPMNNEHVVTVAQNNKTLQFASGIKIARHSHNPFKEQLWVLTNRLQKIFTGTQNFDEINYRILSTSVDSLVKRTKCQLQFP